MRPVGIENQTVTVGDVPFAHNDIFRVVDDFYSRVQHDPMLMVPFQSVHDWPEHIERITHFWWIKFGGKPYAFTYYNPAQKHFYAGFNSELLERWLTLFNDVLRLHLRQDQYEVWLRIAQRMGKGLSLKNDMIRQAFEQDKLKPRNGP